MAGHTRDIQWSNPLVLEFSGESNPVLAIERAARKLVFEARQTGWIGPPFNPVFIAEMLGVSIVPNASIHDARTVLSGETRVIEYNPGQVRERVRFSIAHEIAHLLFSSDSAPVRNRGGSPDESDDWQLELLCNLAASEFVMPIGSLPTRRSMPSIEDLMIERHKFDVSAEAFFIRMVKTTFEPVIMFCASHVGTGRRPRQYRIHYTVPSINSSRLSLVGRRIPADSVIPRCTAIGFTDSAVESWVDGESRTVECVGIPGYPGTNLPRVAGLVRFMSASEHRNPISFIHGNVLRPRGDGNRLVCQLVNDRARRWGGGVARKSAQRFPEAESEFAAWIMGVPRRDRLGAVHFSTPCNGIVIASLVAQEGYGPSLFPRIRYSALEQCLHRVADYSRSEGFTVHMPRLGTGAAGGTWEAVEEMIDECLIPAGLSVTVYDQPPRRPQLQLFE